MPCAARVTVDDETACVTISESAGEFTVFAD